MRASGAATPTTGEVGESRVPAETGFCLGRCYAALSLCARPNMAAVKWPLGTQEDTMEDIASLTGRKFAAEKY